MTIEIYVLGNWGASWFHLISIQKMNSPGKSGRPPPQPSCHSRCPRPSGSSRDHPATDHPTIGLGKLSPAGGPALLPPRLLPSVGTDVNGFWFSSPRGPGRIMKLPGAHLAEIRSRLISLQNRRGRLEKPRPQTLDSDTRGLLGRFRQPPSQAKGRGTAGSTCSATSGDVFGCIAAASPQKRGRLAVTWAENRWSRRIRAAPDG